MTVRVFDIEVVFEGITSGMVMDYVALTVGWLFTHFVQPSFIQSLQLPSLWLPSVAHQGEQKVRAKKEKQLCQRVLF